MVVVVSTLPCITNPPCKRETKKRRRCDVPMEINKFGVLPMEIAPTGNPVEEISLEKCIQMKGAESTEDVADYGFDAGIEASDALRHNLSGLALQIKLKMCIIEAWASDWNSVVMERNLLTVAKELAALKALGLYKEKVCLRFLNIVKTRMMELLEQANRPHETISVDSTKLWQHAQVQMHENVTPQDVNSDFLRLPGYESSIRDASVVWKAMTMARDRGAQLWHDNKHEQALAFLVTADSYMKRFSIKYERIKVDEAMFAMLQEPKRRNISTRNVRFADTESIIGTADPTFDRSPICPSKPSKLESLLLRTSREFPSPVF
uniref:Uncharacterized protein AlNc14C21G2174 n=1 Tax=Albugo laibachii Nc14 TaxID=890382 RepID=F0W5K9_9STRA|nr:conserved hypothetical protein [Albugo laibachii Nc14]|eukprot:CCA16400.1 conserved hypothetical protein [Albugo laibachii Nc14]